MLCPNCKHLNDDSNQFCSQCGHALPDIQIAVSADSKTYFPWKKFIITISLSIVVLLFCSILFEIINLSGTTSDINSTDAPLHTESPVDIARKHVIDKWSSAAGESGTADFIGNIYSQYPDDEVIATLCFYSSAKSYYDLYLTFNDSHLLDIVVEELTKIDPNYSGEFSEEIHTFIRKIIPSGVSKAEHLAIREKEHTYISLTYSEKKAICGFIQDQYDEYDEIFGEYMGDTFTEEIFQAAAEKYGLTVNHIDLIWLMQYS